MMEQITAGKAAAKNPNNINAKPKLRSPMATNKSLSCICCPAKCSKRSNKTSNNRGGRSVLAEFIFVLHQIMESVLRVLALLA